MSDAFISYLNNNVPEYKEYSKKYGTPSVKRINKMVQGIKMPAHEVLERGTNFKNTSFRIEEEFTDVEEFIKYFRRFMVDVENNLRSNRIELFLTARQDHINEQRKLSIKRKMEDLQRELDELGED